MRLGWLTGTAAVAMALGALPSFAQTVIGAKSGVINWAEGDVFLADKPYTMSPTQFGEVKENMVFRTEEGKAEILLPPGVFFRMGEKSSIKMISNRLVDTRLELLAGSAVMEIVDVDKGAAVTLVDKNATITLAKAGIYRFDAEPAQLKVYKGSADVEIGGQTVTVQGGKMLPLGGAVAVAEKFDVASTDSLDHWSRRRAEVVASANVSAAKQAHYGTMGSADPCMGGYGSGTYGNNGPYGTGPYGRPLGTWGYNPWYGFGTYIPCNGRLNSPYGYAMWSPMAAYRQFYAPRPVYTPNPGFGGGGFGNYPTAGTSAGGYSGAASSVSMGAPSSAPAAASSGSSSAAAGASSAGHGGAASGGHGK
jgi:hypothetical protein